MTTIQLEIPDDLAKELVPYQDQLLELLQLGLEQRLAEEYTEHTRLEKTLRSAGKVTSPKPYGGARPYKYRTPLPTKGRPASEIIMECRASARRRCD
jgi:hypothetical protein